MKPTTLDNGIWPDDLNGLEHTLLTVTDNIGWSGNEQQQLSPILVTLIWYPVPGNNILGSSSNEANATTNPDAVNYRCMVNFAR